MIYKLTLFYPWEKHIYIIKTWEKVNLAINNALKYQERWKKVASAQMIGYKIESVLH